MHCIVKNLNIQTGITFKTIKWAFYNDYWCMWHPLTWFSHMLDWQLFGSNAGGHHLVNLIFHIANTLLLFTVLNKMTGSLWPSAFAAALFALHPMHVESVAWIAERKDVLSTFFWFLAMAAYLRYVKKPNAASYLLTLLIFALGLMAKPMLVTLPFVLLLLDYWPLNRLIPQTITSSGRQRRKFAPAANNLPTLYRIVIEKVPFFALSVISSVITFLVQRSGGRVILRYFILLIPVVFHSGRLRPVLCCCLAYLFSWFALDAIKGTCSSAGSGLSEHLYPSSALFRSVCRPMPTVILISRI
jgi:hypothetical protein